MKVEACAVCRRASNGLGVTVRQGNREEILWTCEQCGTERLRARIAKFPGRWKHVEAEALDVAVDALGAELEALGTCDLATLDRIAVRNLVRLVIDAFGDHLRNQDWH